MTILTMSGPVRSVSSTSTSLLNNTARFACIFRSLLVFLGTHINPCYDLLSIPVLIHDGIALVLISALSYLSASLPIICEL